MLFENYSIFIQFSYNFHPKITGHNILKIGKRTIVCINEIIRLIIRKMKMRMKHTSQRYDIYGP